MVLFLPLFEVNKCIISELPSNEGLIVRGVETLQQREHLRLEEFRIESYLFNKKIFVGVNNKITFFGPCESHLTHYLVEIVGISFESDQSGISVFQKLKAFSWYDFPLSSLVRAFNFHQSSSLTVDTAIGRSGQKGHLRVNE